MWQSLGGSRHGCESFVVIVAESRVAADSRGVKPKAENAVVKNGGNELSYESWAVF